MNRAKTSQVTPSSCKQSNQSATPSVLPQEEATCLTAADWSHKLTPRSLLHHYLLISHALKLKQQKRPQHNLLLQLIF